MDVCGGGGGMESSQSQLGQMLLLGNLWCQSIQLDKSRARASSVCSR